MQKLISSYRVKKSEAEALKDKAIQITIAKKELVNEANLIDWLLQNYIEEINPEQWPQKPTEK